MPNYAFAYYGEPKFESPEEGAKYMTKWKAWMSALGDAFVNPGNPFGKPKTVSSGGVSEDGGSNRLTGYSIVKADTMVSPKSALVSHAPSHRPSVPNLLGLLRCEW